MILGFVMGCNERHKVKYLLKTGMALPVFYSFFHSYPVF